jgi:HK97 family phage prohead protease
MTMEVKQLGPFPVEVLDADQGIAAEIIAVFGNVDRGGDRLWPGSFKKTIAERGNQVMVVDSHNHTTVQAVLGVCLGLEEIGRDDLPAETQARFPGATGGVKATTRYLLSTAEGAGAFERRKAGALPGSSFGYDALDHDITEEKINDTDVKVRNLRQVRLYEYGPCVFGMNEATSVVGVKTAAAMEGKPWGIFTRDGEYCVYAVDSDGAATGESRGCHGTLEEAEAQVAALYANTDVEHHAMSEDSAGAIVPEEEEPWWVDASLEDVCAGVSAWANAALGDKHSDTVAGLGDYIRSWIETQQEEGTKEGKAEDDEAGPETEATPPADDGPGPDEGTPPTLEADEIALLAAKIKVAQAQIDLAAIDITSTDQGV